MLAVSFGTDSVKNGTSVNRNATATAPSTILSGLIPGFYALTMVAVEAPFVNWIKVNIPSTGRAGSVITEYQGPARDLLQPRRYVVTLWRQTAGRLTPPPRGPTSRTRFSLANFAAHHHLLDMMSVGFVVG